MISLMKECEYDTRHSSVADLSFLGLEKFQEGAKVCDGAVHVPQNDSSVESRAFLDLNFPEQEIELEASVSENGADASVLDKITVSLEPVSAEMVLKTDGARVSESEAPRVSHEASDAEANMMHGFEKGDMVWGKVKSHPWWPGQIFNETFALPSVRGAKQEGHVLVAFFGDSSYGWFDPAELIPFDPHFREKSRQSSSRNFVNAVEDAVDEASRRAALALACQCRNPFNLRPTSVPEYFAVDVAGYEPGVVYSTQQIKKARERFEPTEALSFMHQLAVMPWKTDSRNISWIKSVAMLLSYRRAVFEEFDETYAEAFGVQPVRPSQDSLDLDKCPSRAPLSGPLVIAEALGDRKISTRTATRAAKDPPLKKSKYLFKRRDEPPITTPSNPLPDLNYVNEVHGNAYSFPVAPSEQSDVYYIPHCEADVQSPNLQIGNFVLQKRTPPTVVAEKKQQPVFARHEDTKAGADETRDSAEKGTDDVADEPGNLKSEVMSIMTSIEQTQGSGSVTDFPTSPPPVVGFGARLVLEASDDLKLKTEPSPTDTDVMHRGRMWRLDEDIELVAKADVDTSRLPEKLTFDLKDEDGVTESVLEALIPAGDGAIGGGDNRSFPLRGVANVPLPMDVELPGKAQGAKVVDGVVKKEKVLKRPREDLTPDKPVDIGEMRKKKKKKLETTPDHPTLKDPKFFKDGESVRKSSVKSVGIGFGLAEKAQAEPQSTSSSAVRLPKLDLDSPVLELPQLVSDLSALALDPFYGIKRNAPSIVSRVFLKFRSLVYQKSLVLPPASEPDKSELPATAGRSPQEPGIANAEVASSGEVREQREPSSLLKPFKKRSLKPDDPTKIGRKRSLSDRQEELSVKRLKKLNQIKALAHEKKAQGGQKTPDRPPRGDQKDISTTAAPAKPTMEDKIKKEEPPPRPNAATPMLLVLKFPPKTTLPSISSLKARFGRFGPIDLHGTHVHWKSHSCRVLFKHKSDAQAAYKYVRNNDLFGQVKVNYHLRELESPVTETGVTVSDQSISKARSDDPPKFRPGNGGSSDYISQPRPPVVQQQWQNSIQPKSCLKKLGDDAGPAAGGAVKESLRVKFLLGGDDGRGKSSVVVDSNTDGRTNAERRLSSFPSFDLNNFGQNSIDSVLPPLLPLPLPHARLFDVHYLPPILPSPRPRVLDVHESYGGGVAKFSQAQSGHIKYKEMEGRERSKVDISFQMLSLLMRCNDVVMHVKSTLGYLPYHPL